MFHLFCDIFELLNIFCGFILSPLSIDHHKFAIFLSRSPFGLQKASDSMDSVEPYDQINSRDIQPFFNHIRRYQNIELSGSESL